MAVWYRVFAAREDEIEPESLLASLRGLGWEVLGKFRGDDRGWFQAELDAGGGEVLQVDRFLVKEEGVRAELNTWAAWVESTQADASRLMEQIITTSQLFTWQGSEQGAAAEADRHCVELCRLLAAETAGVYQIDLQGFFEPDGTLLAKEDA
jgi:hypothetical protein